MLFGKVIPKGPRFGPHGTIGKWWNLQEVIGGVPLKEKLGQGESTFLFPPFPLAAMR
jgi:hypothetical protein